jgi:hypothetical protein
MDVRDGGESCRLRLTAMDERDVVARGEQIVDDRASDEAGAAEHEESHRQSIRNSPVA